MTPEAKEREASPVVQGFRRWGHLQARLDPLGRLRPRSHPEIDGAAGAEADRMRAVYCGPIGAEFMHIPDPERTAWVAARMEESPGEIDRRRILARIASAEIFEQFIHSRYVGSKRYSLEGAAGLIPLLDAILDDAAAAGTEKILIAMSHRGRLSVVTHVVGTPSSHLFAKFEDVDAESVLGGGDVKYHLGATGRYTTASGRVVDVHLVSNPSHLEAVNPVVLGRARARQDRVGSGGRRAILAITIHGDAAFAGQGITAETLNLAGLPGYAIGGTVHIVVNNLIGFTTPPEQSHSSVYATDVAKRLPIPVLHVNGLEPDAVQRAGRIAEGYRAAFGSDVVVDLICLRRHGHSEVDDPTVTQPVLYKAIAKMPPLWISYAKQIGADEEEIRVLERDTTALLTQELAKGRAIERRPILAELPAYWRPYRGGRYDPALEVPTAVPAERLREVAERATGAPEGFTVHPKVKKILDQRREMAQGGRPVDWGMAETLAFGTLLWDGVPVRFSGQDSRRGTFNHRHSVLFDWETGAEHVPLAALHPGGGRFEIYDSPLSEAAVLGYEYGYSRDFPEALVLWEAQFGDFANGAQVIVDQFLTAGEDKWGLLSGIVLLLPHGYEGQGPEHSSARFERYLQLCGEDNIQVCQPTTSAQYFHLIRRQALRAWRKPLVSLMPKGYLRAAAAASPIAAFSDGAFLPVLGDDSAPDADRVLIGTGKILHELRAERARRKEARIAIIGLEQLAPFPEPELGAAIARHPAAREIVWVQEEPANMGALSYVRPRLERIAAPRRVTTVKRAESASPATGSPGAHAQEQAALIGLAFARPESRGGPR